MCLYPSLSYNRASVATSCTCFVFLSLSGQVGSLSASSIQRRRKEDVLMAGIPNGRAASIPIRSDFSEPVRPVEWGGAVSSAGRRHLAGNARRSRVPPRSPMYEHDGRSPLWAYHRGRPGRGAKPARVPVPEGGWHFLRKNIFL